MGPSDESSNNELWLGHRDTQVEGEQVNVGGGL